MDTNNRLVTPLWKWLLPLLLVAAGIVAYAGSFAGAFLLDDYPSILWNMDIRHIFPARLHGRFLTELTYKLTYALGGFNAAYYHAGNLLIHILAGLLLYGAVRRTLLLPSFAGRYMKAAPWLAFITAAIWIVHPLQTESVTYICQRYESMMGLFFLLVLYCFIRGVECGSRHPRLWVDLALAASILGMLTKEVMAVAPLILVLYDYFFIAGSPGEILGQRWRIHAAMFCSLGVLVLMVILTGYTSVSGGGVVVTQSSPWSYLLTQSEVICHYIRLALIPHPLCLDYSWPPAGGLRAVALPGTVILGLLGLAVWGLWRRKAFAFPLMWLFLILAPTSSIMPIGDKAFEHRMYVPLAGIIVLAVAGAYSCIQAVCRNVGRSEHYGNLAGASAALAITCLFGWLTFDRNLTYSSAESMWRDVVAQRPWNVRALAGLGHELLMSGKYKEAEHVSRQLLERLASDASSGPFAYKITPSLALHFQVTALDNLGFALLYSGREVEALDHFEEAVRLRPGDGLARHNLGLALFLSGNTNQALVELESVLAGSPGREKTQSLAAMILARKGDFAGAVEHLRKAVAIEPTYTSAKCELAWLLATSPDDTIRNGDDALPLALEAAESTRYASYHALDVLAAAYAENGKFDKAQKTVALALAIGGQRRDLQDREAQSLWPSMKPDDLNADLQELAGRMRLYARKKAYRVGM